MNARRKHRVFLDHKPPLVAFVLVLVTSMVLLVHVARSDAAPAWLRHGVSSVMAGNLPLAQRVVSGTPLERAEAAPVAEPPAPTPVPARASSAAAAPRAARPPQPRAHGVRGHAHATPSGSAPHAAPAGPGLTPPRPPQAPGGAHPGRGPRGHGVGDIPPGLAGQHGPVPGAGHHVRGAGDVEYGQHPWFGGQHGHGQGHDGKHGHGHDGKHGHGRGQQHGHQHGHDRGHDGGHGHRGHGRH